MTARRWGPFAALIILAVVSATWAYHWLAHAETGRLDTLTGARSGEAPLPVDGSLVAQSFVVPPGGAGDACVHVVNHASGVRRVVIQLLADRDGAPEAGMGRTLVEVPPGTRHCASIRVATAAEPGRTLWVGLRAVSADASSDVAFLMSRDRRSRTGRFLRGGREWWGALGLTVTAPRSTRWDVAWPKALPRPHTRAGVGAVVGLATLIALLPLLAVALTSQSSRTTWILALGPPVLLFALQAASTWTPPDATPTWRGEGRALIDDLWQARIDTSWDTLSGPIDVVTGNIGPARDRALFALPESSVAWEIDVTEPTSLDTAVALRREAWTRAGDGVTFAISVETEAAAPGGRGTAGLGEPTLPTKDVLWEGHVDPYANPDDRQWRDVTVRLDRYVGQTVTLRLTTSAGPSGNAVMDAAMWREPVLRKSVVR